MGVSCATSSTVNTRTTISAERPRLTTASTILAHTVMWCFMMGVSLNESSHVLIVRILNRNVQLLTDPVDNQIGYMIRPIRKAAELHRQVHCILGIVHVGSNLNPKQLLLRAVEDQGHRVLRF